MKHDHEQGAQEPPPGFWGSRYAIGLIVLGAVAGYFLVMEHLAHVVGALPYLLLLVCPLMHVFMHRGQGGHGHHQTDKTIDHGSKKTEPPPPGEQP